MTYDDLWLCTTYFALCNTRSYTDCSWCHSLFTRIFPIFPWCLVQHLACFLLEWNPSCFIFSNGTISTQRPVLEFYPPLAHQLASYENMHLLYIHLQVNPIRRDQSSNPIYHAVMPGWSHLSCHIYAVFSLQFDQISTHTQKKDLHRKKHHQSCIKSVSVCVRFSLIWAEHELVGDGTSTRPTGRYHSGRHSVGGDLMLLYYIFCQFSMQ